MKKFKVTISSQAYSTYIVEAEDENEAGALDWQRGFGRMDLPFYISIHRI